LDNNNFRTILKKTYIKDPCKVLPNAFWKTNERLDQLECSVEPTDINEVILQGWNQSGLHIFWNKSREIESRFSNRVDQSAFAIIHDYFLDERFTMVNVDTKVELEKVSELIGKCYEDIHPSVDTVSSWTEYDVFEEDLWIQVLPGYQGKGLGKILVLELLKRMHGKVDFVTVSGEVDNETNPERLYKSCGFSGDDIWWLLRK